MGDNNCTNSLIFSLALHLAIGYHKRDEKMDGYISSRIGSPSSKKLSAVAVTISYSFDYVILLVLIIGFYTTVIDGFFATGGGSYKKYPLKSRFWELNCGILGLLLSIGSTFVVTQILKNAIGKPRPDIIDRCNIPPEIAAPFLERANFTLVTHAMCVQEDNLKLKDGFRSWPSGHASAAFAGLWYLSLYLMGK